MAIRGANSAIPVTEAVDPQHLWPPKLHWQRATISHISDLVPGVRSFLFALSSPFEYRAGQHVNVRLTAPDGYQVERSYSIASAPNEKGTLELVIERLVNGEVSPFFHDIAAVGDEIEIRGPIGGHFVWSPSDGGPSLLIGGGSGVVPLMSMIRLRQQSESDIPMRLILSASTWQNLIFRDELIAAQDSQKNFDLIIALTREPSRRVGDYGRRVDAAMMAQILMRDSARPKHTFICGSNPFVESAAQGLIAAGLSAAIIRTERYGG